MYRINIADVNIGRFTVNLFIMGIGIIVINVNIKWHTRVPLRHIKKNLRNAMNQFITLNNIIVINVNTIANRRV